MPRMQDVPDPPPAANRDDGLCIAVYQQLRRDIVSGRLRPGVKLAHQAVAEMLDVSRTPVREALERLHQEGFVVREPRRGYFVGEIDSNDAVELYGTREALELYALSRTFERGFKPADLVGLGVINRRYESLILHDLTTERLAVDRAFHLALAGLAGNAYLVRSLDAIFERVILKRQIERVTDRRGTEPYQEHVSLIQALRQQNQDAATLILRNHIRGACERLLQHLQSFSQEDAPPMLRRPRGRRAA